jgi:hypothetical protein
MARTRRAEGRGLAPLCGAAALAASILSCRYDPVPQEIIDSLPPETGQPSSAHRPGQPCLACHSAYAGASPQMTFGGTVYVKDMDGKLAPAAGVEINVVDWAGVPRKACSNKAGNFFLEKANWKDAAFPLKVSAGSRQMNSIIGRDGSCGSCHKIPLPDGEKTLDPVTGANYDSSGAILVDDADIGKCAGGQ